MYVKFCITTNRSDWHMENNKTFSIGKESFLLNGEPFTIVSGAIHYFRVPKEYWRDRLLKLKACGFNTVETYVAWNCHQKNEDAFDELKKLSDKEKQDISYSALMAEYYYNIGDDENTLTWIDKFEQMNPNNPLPYQMRALVFEKHNKEGVPFFIRWKRKKKGSGERAFFP